MWSQLLEGLQFVEQQISQLDQEMASLLRQHQDAVERLVVVRGLGMDSAQQIVAEVGAKALLSSVFLLEIVATVFLIPELKGKPLD